MVAHIPEFFASVFDLNNEQINFTRVSANNLGLRGNRISIAYEDVPPHFLMNVQVQNRLDKLYEKDNLIKFMGFTGLL